MAYEVTATRRRPQAFDALAGQEFVAETLKNAIQSEKIAHAYLFSGPRGCGKTSTARILAKALNCVHGPTATPCGVCQQCVEITKGSSTDVIEIDGASNTSVNDVRQIKDEVLFPPQSSKYKIYIIDEVHMLSTSAFNALLKTIEEPPPYVIFIFATTELQKVPATIKSRCQQFNFRLVPIETVKNLLAQAAAEIGMKADEEALYWVARESTGSVRDAYTLFDQVAAFSGDHITYDKIRDKLGLIGVDQLNAIFEDCAAAKPEDAILKLDTFLQNGISIEQFVANCTDYVRSLLLIKAGITREALLGQSAERFSQAVLAAWTPVQLERALSLLLQLYRDIRYSLSPRYELELAVSRLAWLGEYVSPAEVKRAIDQARGLLAGAPAQSAPAANTPQSAAGTPVRGAQTAQGAPAPHQNAGVAPAQGNGAAAQKSALPVFSALLSTGGGTGVPPGAPSGADSFDADIPDPTPEDAPASFYEGGAEPPHQTGTAYAPAPALADNAAGAQYARNGGNAPPAVHNPLDGGALKDATLKELTVHEPTLAATLMQTGTWRVDGATVTALAESAFLKVQLDGKRARLNALLTALRGTPTEFAVEVQQTEQAPKAAEIPAEVRLVCSLFKGQVVARSPREQQAPPPAPAQQGGAPSEESEPEQNAASDTAADAEAMEENEDESL